MNNTFNQFDQFEVPVSKNRCVFDFVQGSQNLVIPISNPSSTASARGNQVPYPHSFWYIRSKIYSDSTTITNTVKPIIFGKPIISNLYSEYSYNSPTATTQLTSTYPLGFDNSGQEQVPIIQEDALISLIDPNYQLTNNFFPWSGKTLSKINLCICSFYHV